MDVPFKKLTKRERNVVLYGSDGKPSVFYYENDSGGVADVDGSFEGVLTNILRR